jgi:hypothetical protein
VSAVMVFSVVNFTFNDHFPAWDPNGPSAFTHLGLPPWFRSSSRSRRCWDCSRSGCRECRGR